MEDNEKLVTLSKVLAVIITVFGLVSVLALIWAQWRLMQVSLTIVLLSSVAVIVTPDGL